MKRTIESELSRAAAGMDGGEMMAHSRSKGFFFSRSKTSDSLVDRVSNPAEIDRALLRNVESLDDASFGRFADRLTTLRKVRSSTK